MIFDTKIKAEAQASAHLTTNTYYIMFEKKTYRLYVAAIENLLAILWICGESLVIVVRIEKIDHSV